MNVESQQHESIPPPTGPRGFFTGLAIRPIVAGVVIDFVASIVLGFLYLLTYFPKELLESGGLSEEAIDKAVREMMASPEGLLTVTIIGAFGTALGGYVAGRMAKGEKVKHGALVGFVSLVLGLLMTGGSGEGSPVPYWYELLTYLLPVPAGALGAFFAERSGSAPTRV